jgi:hypothetical protein
MERGKAWAKLLNADGFCPPPTTRAAHVTSSKKRQATKAGVTARDEADDAGRALALLDCLGINQPSRPATRDSMRRTWSPHSDTGDVEAMRVHLPASAATEQARNVGAAALVHRGAAALVDREAAAPVDREAMEIGQYWLEMIRIKLNEHQRAPTGPYRLATSFPPPDSQGAKDQWADTARQQDPAGEDSWADQDCHQDNDSQGTHDPPDPQLAHAGQCDLVAVLEAGFNSWGQEETKLADMPPSASRPASSASLSHAQHVARPDSPPVAWLAKIDRPVSFTARSSHHSLEGCRLSLMHVRPLDATPISICQRRCNRLRVESCCGSGLMADLGMPEAIPDQVHGVGHRTFKLFAPQHRSLPLAFDAAAPKLRPALRRNPPPLLTRVNIPNLKPKHQCARLTRHTGGAWWLVFGASGRWMPQPLLHSISPASYCKGTRRFCL